MRAFSLCLIVTLCVAGRLTTAQAQATKHIDVVKAGRGYHIWESRQCGGCHDFGRHQATGPDLQGVTERRSPEWLHDWLKNPEAQDDPTARALRKQFGSQMPNMHLTDQDVDDLIAFLAQQDQKHANKSS